MHCILCTVFYKLYYIQCIICINFYALYSMYCILCSVFYELYSMHFMYSMHCTVILKKYKLLWNTLVTDRQTDRPNDGRTDGRTDIVLYRAAIAAQKSTLFQKMIRAKPGVSKSGALTANLRSSSIYKHIWGCLSSAKRLRSSSIYKTIEVVFHWTQIEVVFHLQN